jgi:hypothetical protein
MNEERHAAKAEAAAADADMTSGASEMDSTLPLGSDALESIR